MTDNETAEYEVLRMLTLDTGKCALEMGGGFPEPEKQFAFQRLINRRWLMLIDISPIAEHPDRLFRIFLASEEALQWYRSRS